MPAKKLARPQKKQPKPKSQGRPGRQPAAERPASRTNSRESLAKFQDETELTAETPPEKQKFCGAPVSKIDSRTGKERPEGATCRRPAGWGTDHPGYGHCRNHRGSTKTHTLSAAKQQIAERIQTYGTPVNVGPHEALVQEVMRTAGHVRWLGEVISQMHKSELVQTTLKEGMTESAWIKIYQEERKMLVQVCRVAISAGVAERRVRIAEEQGKQLAGALLSFINHPALNLSPQQLADAKPLIGEILRTLPDFEGGTGGAGVGVGGSTGKQGGGTLGPREDDIVLEAEEITA